MKRSEEMDGERSITRRGIWTLERWRKSSEKINWIFGIKLYLKEEE
jgi:hypothetical protein